MFHCYISSALILMLLQPSTSYLIHNTSRLETTIVPIIPYVVIILHNEHIYIKSFPQQAKVLILWGCWWMCCRLLVVLVLMVWWWRCGLITLHQTSPAGSEDTGPGSSAQCWLAGDPVKHSVLTTETQHLSVRNIYTYTVLSLPPPSSFTVVVVQCPPLSRSIRPQ